MSGATHHVFRRGLDVVSNHMAKPPADDDPEAPKLDIPIWGIILLVVTVAAFALAIPAVCLPAPRPFLFLFHH